MEDDDYRYYYITEYYKGNGSVLAVDLAYGLIAFIDEYKARFGRNPIILSKIGLSTQEFKDLCSMLDNLAIFDGK